MKRRKNSDSSHKHQGVRTVEKTASGKFMVRARKRKIPEKEHEKTVDSIDEGIARLAKLDKLYLRKVAVAQRVERQLPKLNVAGSSPISRSKLIAV
jgi:hypothetical protein